MNVYKKLQAARTKLHKTPLGKSGKNSFAKFNYFELGDFIPEVTAIFDELGLCAVVNFQPDVATLTIHDTDTEGQIVFSTPLVHANMDRVQAIQNLGATHTYMRRYLWLMAMEIVENDVVDAAEPKAAPIKPTPKVEPKEEPKAEPKKLDLKGKPGSWQIQITGEGEWDTLIMQSANILLEVARSPEDCVNIFKVNHSIFEKMKQEYPDQYTELMATFKARKAALTQE
jgi:ERF superfamily